MVALVVKCQKLIRFNENIMFNRKEKSTTAPGDEMQFMIGAVYEIATPEHDNISGLYTIEEQDPESPTRDDFVLAKCNESGERRLLCVQLMEHFGLVLKPGELESA